MVWLDWRWKWVDLGFDVVAHLLSRLTDNLLLNARLLQRLVYTGVDVIAHLLSKLTGNMLQKARLVQKLVDGRALVRLGLEHHLNQILNVLSDVAAHWAVLSRSDGHH